MKNFNTCGNCATQDTCETLASLNPVDIKTISDQGVRCTQFEAKITRESFDALLEDLNKKLAIKVGRIAVFFEQDNVVKMPGKESTRFDIIIKDDYTWYARCEFDAELHNAFMAVVEALYKLSSYE